MKKALSSCLVIVITFISIIAMNTFKSKESYEATIMDGEVREEVDKSEGTGLIFEDFDKNINIPINSSKEEKKTPDKVEPKVDNTSNSTFNLQKLKRLMEEQVTDLRKQKNAKEYVSLGLSNSGFIDYSQKYEVQSVEASVSLQDKTYLMKLAKYLNIDDINEIRKAISEGANNDELRAIWDNLKKKVPEDEYENLVKIVSKYE